MNNLLKTGFGLAIVALAAALFAQSRSINALKSELAALRESSTGASEAAAPAATAKAVRPSLGSGNTPVVAGFDPVTGRRLDSLEASVKELAQNARLLMERGQLPLSAEMLEEVRNRFLNPAGTSRERLEALRLLGRNRALSDETVLAAANWALSSTNGNVAREILDQIGGATNAVLRGPLVQLATTSTDARVRAEALESLGRFSTDLEVSQLLWKTIASDPDERVRRSAQEALQRAPMTEERLADLRQRAQSAQASPEERLVAVRTLLGSKADVTEVGAAIAAQVNATQDPVAKAQLLRSLDDFGNPVVLPTLVGGLQDPDATVRLRATDALSSFAGDATVQQWLRYLLQNDPDPLVKREASIALGENRGEGRRDDRGGSGDQRRGPRP